MSSLSSGAVGKPRLRASAHNPAARSIASVVRGGVCDVLFERVEAPHAPDAPEVEHLPAKLVVHNLRQHDNDPGGNEIREPLPGLFASLRPRMRHESERAGIKQYHSRHLFIRGTACRPPASPR
jgi:hypothetical protein